jgi:HSP20 family protein
MEFGASVTPPGFGLRREIDRIVGDVFTQKPRDRRRPSPPPTMEMRETDRELTLMLELPDATVAEIEIAVHDGVLTICERMEPAISERDQPHPVAKRRNGAFQQSVQLPKDADAMGIVSQLDGSVLTVRIPKVRDTTLSPHPDLPEPAARSASMPPVAMAD